MHFSKYLYFLHVFILMVVRKKTSGGGGGEKGGVSYKKNPGISIIFFISKFNTFKIINLSIKLTKVSIAVFIFRIHMTVWILRIYWYRKLSNYMYVYILQLILI